MYRNFFLYINVDSVMFHSLEYICREGPLCTSRSTLYHTVQFTLYHFTVLLATISSVPIPLPPYPIIPSFFFELPFAISSCFTPISPFFLPLTHFRFSLSLAPSISLIIFSWLPHLHRSSPLLLTNNKATRDPYWRC